MEAISPASDESEILTAVEGQYLNLLFQLHNHSVDLRFKRVAFITGSLGKHVVPKTWYFKSPVYNPHGVLLPIPEFLYILNENQKSSVGYDAIVNFWTIKQPSLSASLKVLKKYRQHAKDLEH